MGKPKAQHEQDVELFRSTHAGKSLQRELDAFRAIQQLLAKIRKRRLHVHQQQPS